MDAARSALESDPEAAANPFWDHGVEPPLCVAVRLGCGPAIVQLLLDYKADVNAKGPNGETALEILQRKSLGATSVGGGGGAGEWPWMLGSRTAVEQGRALIMEMLLNAGACPTVLDEAFDEGRLHLGDDLGNGEPVPLGPPPLSQFEDVAAAQWAAAFSFEPAQGAGVPGTVRAGESRRAAARRATACGSRGRQSP